MVRELNSAKNLEIEHKYLLHSESDLRGLRNKILDLGPLKTFEVESVDFYFLPKKAKASSPLILRYRHDRLKSELTAKTFGGDTEKRLEINLPLENGNLTQVEFFLEVLGFEKILKIQKKSMYLISQNANWPFIVQV